MSYGDYGRKRARDDRSYYARDPRSHPVHLLVGRLRKDILRFCDPNSNRTPAEDINHLVYQISNDSLNADESSARSVASAIIASINEMPLRIPYLATAAMASLRDSLVSQITMKLLPELCQSALDESDLLKLVLRLRFAAYCDQVFEGSPFLTASKLLLSLASEAEPRAASAIVYGVLANVPHAVVAAKPEKEMVTHCTALLDEAEKLVPASTGAVIGLESPWNLHDSTLPYDTEANILLLVKALREFLALPDAAAFDKLDRPWESSAAAIANSPLQSFGELVKPAAFKLRNDDFSASYPKFGVYFDQAVKTTPAINTLESQLFRCSVVETLNALEINREQCARMLTDLDVYFPYGVFALRGVPIKELETFESGQSTLKLEDIFIETLFAEMFRLPKPSHLAVYYHSVITEACNTAPKIMAPTIGRAIRAFFNNAEQMEPEALLRFVEWFTHHLSNFSFSWKWSEWVEYIDLEPDHPKVAIIKNAIEKEVQLSYHGRILDSLPEEFAKFLTAESPGSHYPYESEDHALAAQAKKIMEILRLDEPRTKLIEELEKVDEDTRRTVLLNCVLHLGSRVMSFCLKALDSLGDLLKEYYPTTEDEMAVLDVVTAFWVELRPNALTVAEAMIDLGILSPLAVARWTMSPEHYVFLTSDFSWLLMKYALEVGPQNAAAAAAAAASSPGEPMVDDAEPGSGRAVLFATLLATVPDAPQAGAWQSFWRGGFQRFVARRYAGEIKLLGRALEMECDPGMLQIAHDLAEWDI